MSFTSKEPATAACGQTRIFPSQASGKFFYYIFSVNVCLYVCMSVYVSLCIIPCVKDKLFKIFLCFMIAATPPARCQALRCPRLAVKPSAAPGASCSWRLLLLAPPAPGASTPSATPALTVSSHFKKLPGHANKENIDFFFQYYV